MAGWIKMGDWEPDGMAANTMKAGSARPTVKR
jgi:hypothetical protein